MNFGKWFLYFIGFGAFVWFVFFRPMGNGSALASTEKGDAQQEETDPSSTDQYDNTNTEDGIDYSETDEDYATDVETETVEPTEDKSESIASGNSINLDSRYLIVVGSFGVKANADRLLKKTIADGRDAKTKYINGLHRVVAAASDDEANAKDLRAHFTHVYKVKAFILEQ